MADQQDAIVTKKGVKVRKTASTGRPVEVEMPDGEIRVKCQYCGKWINSEKALDAEAGHHCLFLREELGLSDEALSNIRSGKTVTEVPVTEDGREWVKVAVVDRACKKQGIPISALVKAFGGDRGLDAPLNEKWAFVYCGRARYLHPDCNTPEGYAELKRIARTPKTPLKDDGEIPADAPIKTRRSVRSDTAEVAAALKS